MTKAKDAPRRINAENKIWIPQKFEVNIGPTKYVIEPQPLKQLLLFDGVLSELSDSFSVLSARYYIVIDGQRAEGLEPFENEVEAREYIAEQEWATAIIEPVTPDASEILQAIVHAPFPIMKVLIPELVEDDVLEAPPRNLEHVIRLLLDLNGTEWFEAVVKKFVAPMLPRVLESAIGAATASIGSTTSSNGTAAPSLSLVGETE
jgi:hypothetical protein